MHSPPWHPPPPCVAGRQSWSHYGNAIRPHTKCKKNSSGKALDPPIVLHFCVNEQRTPPILSKKCLQPTQFQEDFQQDWLTRGRASTNWGLRLKEKYTTGRWIAIRLRWTVCDAGFSSTQEHGTTAYCKRMRRDRRSRPFFLCQIQNESMGSCATCWCCKFKQVDIFWRISKKYIFPIIHQSANQITNDTFTVPCGVSVSPLCSWDENRHCLVTCQVHTCSSQTPWRHSVSVCVRTSSCETRALRWEENKQ